MNTRRLRWQARALLRELDIRPPLDVTELCRRYAESRGRPIVLLAWDLKVPGPFAYWFDREQDDRIVYQRLTTPAHQDQLILHELGHIFFDHGVDATDQEVDEIPDDLPDVGSRRRLRRTCYDTQPEQEAELFATVVMQGTGALHPSRRLPRDFGGPESQGVSRTLSLGVGWNG